MSIWRALTYPRRLREAQRRIIDKKAEAEDMKIDNEQQALEAMEAVVQWAESAPDSTFGGPTTGVSFQRGRVIASRTHDGTMGMSNYHSAGDAAQKNRDMEQGYQNWMRMRDAKS